MPKVKSALGKGVRVSGAVRDFTGAPEPGRKITISLPVVCTWRGTILVNKQVVATDKDGAFVLWLPPTSELRPVDEKDFVPDYTIACEGLGTWKFRVPDGISSMQIGETAGGKHGVSK